VRRRQTRADSSPGNQSPRRSSPAAGARLVSRWNLRHRAMVPPEAVAKRLPCIMVIVWSGSPYIRAARPHGGGWSSELRPRAASHHHRRSDRRRAGRLGQRLHERGPVRASLAVLRPQYEANALGRTGEREAAPNAFWRGGARYHPRDQRNRHGWDL
jgi:hypothetical protein